MKIATPALDQLTARVTSQVAEGISAQIFPGFLGSDEKPLIPPITRQRIKDGNITTELVHQLHSAGRIRGHDYIAAREHSMQRTARELGMSELVVEAVFKVLSGFKSAIDEVMSDTLRRSEDADVGAVLIELFHIDYDDFDPDLPGNELDYNADDLLPEDCETPHNYLSDLILDAVTARIIKRNGRELVLAWLQAQNGADT
ncbi:hypothetical protein EV643_14815 [Kribbella sp. VKM Ac-2527]|uniref:Uncharacterized protein n=1 Tax=Kribbella caucasensis TaxID=2512215 RepID=A0A4R6J2J3_9ACTN|nr:hypothetical protein [Kribbella sp. VKM Ac-2527]TDO29494.1 hypothetical protein EV643_14815 [Kribbella sp. VKM Ac-2527]